MKEDRRLLFTFFTMMVCFGIGSYIMCTDLVSVPKKDSALWHELYPNHTAGIADKYEQEQRFWEWNLGNHYVSAIENIVMMLTLFFGFMRFVDLNKEFQRVEKERRWIWFWNLCEDNVGDNNY